MSISNALVSDETAIAAVPHQRSGEELVESAAHAFFATWTAMTAALPGGSYVAEAGVVRARMGLPVPAFNGVWGAHRQVRADDVLAAVDDFASGDLPWNLQLRPGYPVELDEALQARDLVCTEDIPFMVLPDVAAVPAPATPAMREVVSFEDVAAALTLIEQGFGMPSELVRGRFPIRSMFLAGTTAWIAHDDVDVSTALATVHGDMCGIFNVATPEEHRGRGFGRAVTAQAIAMSGARSAYLQSSPMGYPVYEAMGFYTAERWRQWMPAEYVDPH
jgi:GNAT superfamily N-acetyltransferase